MKNWKEGWGYSSVLEGLPNMWKILDSASSTAETKL